jgi:hypothetical protein
MEGIADLVNRNSKATAGNEEIYVREAMNKR